MRDDWNRRAREDAHYYVAFGRRDQADNEFFETGSQVVSALRQELKRGVPAEGRARRFLEIGCGPGRLMKPMSANCGEIHGVDVSDEMIARARANLASVPHAHAHTGTGATLDGFASDSFDFVYSYAVFQHIPSPQVVWSYLNEVLRVLKPGGLARLQINGLPPTAKAYTTWEGVRIQPDEIRDFAARQRIRLLALEGLGTQYMWTTWRKAAPEPQTVARIHRVTNAFSSEPVAPLSGRFACVALWVEGLAESADLNTMDLRIGGQPAVVTYAGAPEPDGLRQVSALLPAGLATGLAAVELGGAVHRIRLVPPPPQVPCVVALTDGVDLLSPDRIHSGLIKLTVEEFAQVERFHATLDGIPVTGVEHFCIDPAPPRHEINLRVPAEVAPGERRLLGWLGRRSVIDRKVTIQ